MEAMIESQNISVDRAATLADDLLEFVQAWLRANAVSLGKLTDQVAQAMSTRTKVSPEELLPKAFDGIVQEFVVYRLKFR